jgi:hypothetical protein
VTMDKTRADILSRISSLTKDLSLFEHPTPEQRAAKERFWRPFLSGDTQVPAERNLATALKFASDSRISKWWDIPGFQDWFYNDQEFKDRVELIAHLALDGITEVLKDKMATPSAKVAAAKLALEVAGKMPKALAKDQAVGDSDIDKMTKEELDAFIREKTNKVNA